MKIKAFTAVAAAATLVISCSSGATQDATDDSSYLVEEQEMVVALNDGEDTTAAEEVKEDAPAEATPEQVKEAAPGNNLDSEVDAIVRDINKCTSTIKDLTNNGILNSSSMALRYIESLPDYERKLNRIKGQLSPQQKARIDAAERAYNRAIDEWDDQSDRAIQGYE